MLNSEMISELSSVFFKIIGTENIFPQLCPGVEVCGVCGKGICRADLHLNSNLNVHALLLS